jgi:hypothetical protein
MECSKVLKLDMELPYGEEVVVVVEIREVQAFNLNLAMELQQENLRLHIRKLQDHISLNLQAMEHKELKLQIKEDKDINLRVLLAIKEVQDKGPQLDMRKTKSVTDPIINNNNNNKGNLELGVDFQ